ncbi:MAG: hypothetical protein HY893_08170 [Deltaproteobacteria bacterium]|nr:hypothetical protein [Deltaproteobacteria bacterium]
MKILVPIIYTAFGWLLGFFGTLLQRWLEKKRLREEFKKTLSTELKEMTTRLVGSYFQLIDAFVGLNRDDLTWLYSMSSAFPGELSEETFKTMEGLLKLRDDELAKIAALRKKTESLFLKKYNLPFLEESITSLTLLDSSLQTSVLAIRRNIVWLNEAIDRCNFFYEKSFDQSLSGENHLIMRANMKEEYKRMAQSCRKTADLCSKTISDMESSQ